MLLSMVRRNGPPQPESSSGPDPESEPYVSQPHKPFTFRKGKQKQRRLPEKAKAGTGVRDAPEITDAILESMRAGEYDLYYFQKYSTREWL
jgi:hypothetical protein